MSNTKRGLLTIFTMIFVGICQFGYYKGLDSKILYLASLAIVICAVVLFYLSFENRKPNHREVVMISVISAIAAVSRLIFFMIPQVKPMGAIIIICGVCFGKEWGFLVGSISAFISNFFFGQGPFTPFIMLGFGLLGYVCGLVFYNKQPKTWILSVFGFFVTYIVYGGIVNWGYLIMFSDKISLSYVLTVFGVAFYFDLVHCVSTAFFICVLYNGFSKRFNRIKDKYGLKNV